MEKDKTNIDIDRNQPESNESSQEAKAQAVNTLATEFHENWRKNRLKEDGSFEPRVKSTKDEVWISSHGTNQVDIANTDYEDLPSDWQVENKAAAEVIVNIIDQNDGMMDISQEEVRSHVGEIIHDAWLSRNEWAKGGNLDVPFVELPKEEQEKDIDQFIIAQSVFGK